jgi:hypothetical protein
MTDLDRMWQVWRPGPRRPPSSDELRAALDRSSKLYVRLGIRLSLDSDVARNFNAAKKTAYDVGFTMASFRPTHDVVIKVNSLRDRALGYQDAFTAAARQILSPP